VTDDRQIMHAMKKCVAIGGITSTKRSDYA